MFPDFDHALLEDPEFKEDSVREVIITPILSRLGYTPSGSDRVIRSKTLVHPFIYAGTRRVPITLIPDYTLLSEGRVVCVLDAKRPSEDILSRKHIQQAYSYAIHPEIKWGQEGRDGLGYDFCISFNKQTWYIEVKASTEDPCQFELGETEVRKARDVARSRSAERYVIAYLANVGQTGSTMVDILPNPLRPDADGVLNIAGDSIRYNFSRRR